MSLRRAKNSDEYIAGIEGAVFEVKDLNHHFMFEIEARTRFPGWAESLEQSVLCVH